MTKWLIPGIRILVVDQEWEALQSNTPTRVFACAVEAECYDSLVTQATRGTLLHAATEAVKLARSGMSAIDAVLNISDRFKLDTWDAGTLEMCVRSIVEPVRVRAHSGVAIGWVRPKGDGSWTMEHDRWGKADYVYSTKEAAMNRVRRADEGGGF